MDGNALNNCIDQLDVQITRDDEDFDREKCAYCGCHLPVDGLPCECEEEHLDD